MSFLLGATALVGTLTSKGKYGGTAKAALITVFPLVLIAVMTFVISRW